MSQIIYSTVHTQIKFVVYCPKCHREYDVDAEDFTKANNWSIEYSCYDCQADFTAVMPGLTRVVEQRDEAAKQDGAGESPKSLRTED